MRVAIHQPNYAPWCGYFAKMNCCDVFVFLDDAQMPGGQSYVYRTQVRSTNQGQWLSIPTRFRLGDLIHDVRFADTRWPTKHLGTLRALYGRSPHFKEVYQMLQPLYEEPGEFLALFNQRFIRVVADYLGLRCRFEVSSHLPCHGFGDDRLISLVQGLAADTYVSGKGGQNYQHPDKFSAAGIKLEVRSYAPVFYQQMQSGFLPGLSILDALFNLGKSSIHVLIYPINGISGSTVNPM